MSDPLVAERPRRGLLARRWILANAVARWLVANGLGWAVGMPLVFAAVRNLALHGGTARQVAWSAAALLLAGALVGLVESIFVVRLFHPRKPGSARENI